MADTLFTTIVGGQCQTAIHLTIHCMHTMNYVNLKYMDVRLTNMVRPAPNVQFVVTTAFVTLKLVNVSVVKTDIKVKNVRKNVGIRSMVPDVQKTVDIVSMENSVTMSTGLATMVVKLASINLDVKEVAFQRSMEEIVCKTAVRIVTSQKHVTGRPVCVMVVV